MDDEDDNENPKPSLATLLFFLGVVIFLIAFAQYENCARAHADELQPADPLVLAVMDLQPDLTVEEATWHVSLARDAVAGTNIEVERILGMTDIESTFDPRTVSRLECFSGVCHRKLGVLLAWGPHIKGPYFCGVMQVRAKHECKRCSDAQQRKRCDQLREDTSANYKAGVEILTSFYNDPRCRKRRDRMYCALLGVGGGYPLIEIGKHRYPGKVERRMQRVKKLSAAHASS